MIVLDTNVLSEPLRPRPSPAVLDWLAALDEPAAITAVSVGEILCGARFLPNGRRRAELIEGIESIVRAFRHDILPYGEASARAYAELSEKRRGAGRALSVEDGMIAAICRTHGATLATRNERDFDDLGIDIVNPWAL
ncbi:type II toxin-antitoxin system VapC family toxin [Herbiconiux sp. CPCC 205763]|uniref:Ribonuclease VapC n=1 Tax=Herbiconiux aconitum TaxID=2970913 RepID=A0ABT2GXM4_9MICO|nr:type II toxin-antitoxin system VapC family toxin [Herbiconiux aconitum]MCS5720060.1 type II toxin-antitoxin system VapC family toxin [Herbiconiux aconitum]